jgi:hypothetical protein
MTGLGSGAVVVVGSALGISVGASVASCGVLLALTGGRVAGMPGAAQAARRRVGTIKTSKSLDRDIFSFLILPFFVGVSRGDLPNAQKCCFMP